jgi:hypothetical protein
LLKRLRVIRCPEFRPRLNKFPALRKSPPRLYACFVSSPPMRQGGIDDFSVAQRVQEWNVDTNI